MKNQLPRSRRCVVASLLLIVATGACFVPRSQSIADIGYVENIPVRFELPESPSSNLLGDMVPSWYITVLAGNRQEVRVVSLHGITTTEENGKYFVECGITPDLVPSRSIFRIAFRDSLDVFEPCTSSAEISTYNLVDIQHNLVILFFLRYSRFTTINLLNSDIAAEFHKDSVFVKTNRLRIKADPSVSASSHTITVAAPGYRRVAFDLMIDRIGEPAELSVLLHTVKDNLLFEKIAYLYQKGYCRTAAGLVEKIEPSAAGRWGYLQLYKALAYYGMESDGKKTGVALSIVNNTLEQARLDNNYMLKALLGLVKAQLHVTSGEYAPAALAAAEALSALDEEEAIFGVSRMEPPCFFLGSWEIRGMLKFYQAVAETESNSKDRSALLEQWNDVRRLTEKILADSQGKELLRVNPFEERIQAYENRLK